MSTESHAELQKWFAEKKATPECQLALKHYRSMPAAARDHFLAAYPDADADANERELALLFALTQHAEQLDTVALLLANLRVEASGVVLPPPPETKPESLAASHVDIVVEPFETDDKKPTE